MDADRPITTVADDRLGFAPVARHLAQVILDQSAKDGLVFGVEGEWGSGKSTLINLTISALRDMSPSPEIVEYSPWLVGSRDDLLIHLFDELATAVERIEPAEPTSVPQTWGDCIIKWVRRDAHHRLKHKERLRRELGGKLKAFGAAAGGLSKLIKSSAVFGVPYTEVASTVVDRAGESAKNVFASTSISKRKAEIVAALKLLPRRIVVFVDDLDRLEPREASEVLRLIRAVADFPNIIYVLSYDASVVANTLKRSIHVDNGQAFLEKIVQVSFKVPRPEAFDLRRWLYNEIFNIFPDEVRGSSNMKNYDFRRLEHVIDAEGGRYLTKPRDVIRVLNALRLHAVPVRANIDLADMVSLQLARIGNNSFYAWIEEYVTATSAIYAGADVTRLGAADMGRRLDVIFKEEKLDIDDARIMLSKMLPGVSPDFAHGDEGAARKVFNGLGRGREVFNPFIIGRRLSSPEHYRYYFAFSQPSGALGDDQLNTFVDMAKIDRTSTISRLQILGGQERPQGGVMAELLIERLIAIAQQIPVAAIPNILSALSDTLDDIAYRNRNADWGHFPSWGAAGLLVEKLMRRTTDRAVREEYITRLFAEGRAIGWQTDLFRDETFAHGHYGDRREPEGQRLLTPDEFQQVLAIMIRRYPSIPPKELMAVPNLVSLLFGWKQAAENDDACFWVEANTEKDDDLLYFLSRARGWSVSSDKGLQYPLRRQDLSPFLNYDTAINRVRAIADDAKAAPEVRQRATELLDAFEQGERD